MTDQITRIENLLLQIRQYNRELLAMKIFEHSVNHDKLERSSTLPSRWGYLPDKERDKFVGIAKEIEKL